MYGSSLKENVSAQTQIIQEKKKQLGRMSPVVSGYLRL